MTHTLCESSYSMYSIGLPSLLLVNLCAIYMRSLSVLQSALLLMLLERTWAVAPLAAVCAAALGAIPKLDDEDTARASGDRRHAVLLVRAEDLHVATLEDVRVQGAIALECLERAALKIDRRREHAIDGDE